METEFTLWVLREMEKYNLTDADLRRQGISLDAVRQAQVNPLELSSTIGRDLAATFRMNVLFSLSRALNCSMAEIMVVYKDLSQRR